MLMGMSQAIRAFPTGIRIIMAEAPTITRVLKMLLPTILPTLISALPLRTLKKLTMNSGRLVPRATIVRPITISLTFQRRAIPQAPSVNLSAPHNTRTMPTRSNKQFIIIISGCKDIMNFRHIVNKIGIISLSIGIFPFFRPCKLKYFLYFCKPLFKRKAIITNKYTLNYES